MTTTEPDESDDDGTDDQGSGESEDRHGGPGSNGEGHDDHGNGEGRGHDGEGPGHEGDWAVTARLTTSPKAWRRPKPSSKYTARQGLQGTEIVVPAGDTSTQA